MGLMSWPALAGKRDTQQQPPAFEPAAMLDIEVSRALPESAPLSEELGIAYRRALILVRLHTRPLGVIELFADADGFSAGQLARQVDVFSTRASPITQNPPC